MFEQTFKNIDDILYKDSGADSELDYIGQTLWILFLRSLRYVEFYLNSIRLDPFVSGMAQPKLNQVMLNKIPIPFQPLSEQQKIVNQLDAMSVETSQLEKNYQKKLESLEELKKSIFQKAFTGELTNKKYKITEQEKLDMVVESEFPNYNYPDYIRCL